MKKSTLYLMLMVSSLSILTSISAAEKKGTAISINEIPTEVQLMYDRLDEIKAIDKTSLATIDKKELRKEVQTIKANLRASNNGVYLSIGAIIIIILLMILLL